MGDVLIEQVPKNKWNLHLSGVCLTNLIHTRLPFNSIYQSYKKLFGIHKHMPL